jgi:2-polyprenyl-3-methyl-5-hydroxy-6-metoxy-1,4-benzoquinol methylase
MRYVGVRTSQLTFGDAAAMQVLERIRTANADFHHLRLEEEQRLAVLNARWRSDLIRRFRPSGKLLEVGCARGDFLRVAAESFDVFGVEPNPELAESAAHFAPIHRDLVETLPWKDFDVAASFHVIEHVDSPRTFVQAIAARLKPGGLLVLETPNIASPSYRVMKKRWRQFIPEHYFFFTPQTATKLLAESGFKVERIDPIGKYASVALIMNRLSRYSRVFRYGEDFATRSGLSRITFRVNPLDIMLVFAVKL